MGSGNISKYLQRFSDVGVVKLTLYFPVPISHFQLNFMHILIFKDSHVSHMYDGGFPAPLIYIIIFI